MAIPKRTRSGANALQLLLMKLLLYLLLQFLPRFLRLLRGGGVGGVHYLHCSAGF